MESNQRVYHLEPIAIIFMIFQIVFMIFAGIAIEKVINDKAVTAKIDINNLSAELEKSNTNHSIEMEPTTNLSDSQKSAVESVLYDIVSLNTNSEILNRKAEIRSGSVYNVLIDDLKINFLNFIVDIENLRQSYRIVYRWADDYPNENAPANNPVMAFCLKTDELIYEDFGCRDNYNGHGADIVVYGLLKNKLFRNFSVGVSGDIYNNDALIININTISDNDTAKASAVLETSNYLKSLGFNLDDFEYIVGTIEVAN